MLSRTKSSIWTTLAAAPTNEDGTYRCRLGFSSVRCPLSSSSNVISHHRMRRKQIAAEVFSAELIIAKMAAMERAIAQANSNHQH